MLVGNNNSLRYSLVFFRNEKIFRCRNPGLALPLIALQYHEVKFNISFQPVSSCLFEYSGTGATTQAYSGATPSLGYASLWIDYVYLDTDERRQFAQVQHETYVLKSNLIKRIASK